RAGVRMAVVAKGGGGQEDRLARRGEGWFEREGFQIELLVPPREKLERLQGVELLVRGQPEVIAIRAPERLREVLKDGARGEVAQRAAARRPVSRPTGALVRRRRGSDGIGDREGQSECVGYAAH